MTNTPRAGAEQTPEPSNDEPRRPLAMDQVPNSGFDSRDGGQPLNVPDIAADLVRRWHEKHFGLRIEEWKLDALREDITKAIVTACVRVNSGDGTTKPAPPLTPRGSQ